MVKSRKRKVQEREDGDRHVYMDVSADAPPASQHAPEDAMDTSEVVVTSHKLSVNKPGKSRSRGIAKVVPKRRAVKIRKQKAVEKALSMMEKSAEKRQKLGLKADRIMTLKKLY
eukprot:TRINITY_DN1617_c0_g1_i2.p1 TRINITY_DN1617_c0_g1~~TRINITY_DN1617_c0_g1_i2.p1  ORF type:complete len:114 (-),score=24.03 TRINITY_DN1617_c0_g1_i2:232-573(-)